MCQGASGSMSNINTLGSYRGGGVDHRQYDLYHVKEKKSNSIGIGLFEVKTDKRISRGSNAPFGIFRKEPFIFSIMYGSLCGDNHY